MYKSPSLNPLSIENITTPIDQTRRKRLKVLSACNECRRKKTKCNGEKPCTGCLKANVECKYSNNNVKKVPQQHISRPTVAPITPRNLAPPPQPQPQPISQSQANSMANINTTLWNTVQSIEGRLSTIENILQILLQQQQQQQQQQQTVTDHHQVTQRPVIENRRPSDDKYYRRDSYYYSGEKKRKFEETQMKLPSPTIGHYHSDTSSTTSSVCSSLASPKITAISSLLNNEKSSIYKPTILQNHDYF